MIVMPASIGIRFAHASLQVLAEDARIDLLHIKGPAIDHDLIGREASDDASHAVAQIPSRASVDADVLVRPSHLPAILDVMQRHGWVSDYGFEDDSPFEHAATMKHALLGPVDLHRRFPGIGLSAEAAFDLLWVDRCTVHIAGYPCTVPSVTGQRLILLLSAARDGVAGHPDIDPCWTNASGDAREGVVALADKLDADVALAAASGRLDDFRGRREHPLWLALSNGETSMPKIWAARVRAEQNPRAAIRMGVRLIVPNRGRLEASLGRMPTQRELAQAWVDRTRWGAGELRRFVAGLRRKAPR